MRGKGPIEKGKSETYRITPAYAGKRRHAVHLLATEKDHPRLCGEKYNMVALILD